MKKTKPTRKGGRRAPKSVLRLPDLDVAKSAVLNALSGPAARRGYRHAIDEFVVWYCSEPRLKAGHLRTVPVPDWVYGLVDDWGKIGRD